MKLEWLTTSWDYLHSQASVPLGADCGAALVSALSTEVGSGAGTCALPSALWTGGVSPALWQAFMGLPIRQGCLRSQASVPLGADSGAGTSRSAPPAEVGSGTGVVHSPFWTGCVFLALLWQVSPRLHLNIYFKALLCCTER